MNVGIDCLFRVAMVDPVSQESDKSLFNLKVMALNTRSTRIGRYAMVAGVVSADLCKFASVNGGNGLSK